MELSPKDIIFLGHKENHCICEKVDKTPCVLRP
jgi:hypothetical protein